MKQDVARIWTSGGLHKVKAQSEFVLKAGVHASWL